jgi:hypothetical protein
MYKDLREFIELVDKLGALRRIGRRSGTVTTFRCTAATR